MKFLVSPLPSYCSLGGSRSSKPPLARVPGVGILRTVRHLQLLVVKLVVLVALEEVGLAVRVGGGRVQVAGDLPTPLTPGQSPTRLQRKMP